MFWKPWNTMGFRKKSEKKDYLRAPQNDKIAPPPHKNFKNSEILVDETVLLGYNEPIVHIKRL